jgi:hypothetical protein
MTAPGGLSQLAILPDPFCPPDVFSGAVALRRSATCVWLGEQACLILEARRPNVLGGRLTGRRAIASRTATCSAALQVFYLLWCRLLAEGFVPPQQSIGIYPPPATRHPPPDMLFGVPAVGRAGGRDERNRLRPCWTPNMDSRDPVIGLAYQGMVSRESMAAHTATIAGGSSRRRRSYAAISRVCTS